MGTTHSTCQPVTERGCLKHGSRQSAKREKSSPKYECFIFSLDKNYFCPLRVALLRYGAGR